MIDLDAMRTIAFDFFAWRIEKRYGQPGSRALRELLIGIKTIHRQLAYEMVGGGLTVVASLDPERELTELGVGTKISSAELTTRFRGAATVQVLPTGDLRFWPELVPDFNVLDDVAVVYHYRDGDFFFVDGTLTPVPNPLGFPSVFGYPTFVDLDRALHYYGDAMARRSTCRILRQIWHGGIRILLVNKPEHIMRSSLAQFLRCTLRDHELVEVREEQNVDETQPIDIKVTWSMSNRLALIEIKWLGDSVHKELTHVSTSYGESRARDGADQLVRYLEANLERAPRHITRGYLVVFDARRKGINRETLAQAINQPDAEHYANAEVDYNPRYEEIRRDFAPPVRFFLEPRQEDIA